MNVSAIPMNNVSQFFGSYGLTGYLNTDIPEKGMMILTEKHNDLYGIFLLSPRENFDSELKLVPLKYSIETRRAHQFFLIL